MSNLEKKKKKQEREPKGSVMIRSNGFAFGTNIIKLLYKLQAKHHYKDFQY